MPSGRANPKVGFARERRPQGRSWKDSGFAPYPHEFLKPRRGLAQYGVEVRPRLGAAGISTCTGVVDEGGVDSLSGRFGGVLPLVDSIR